MKKISCVAIIVSLMLVVGTASSARADNLQGACTAIIANALGPAFQFARTGDLLLCVEIGNAFLEFVTTEGGACFFALEAGELRGLAGPASNQPAGPNEGFFKNVGATICTAVIGCGINPPEPICVGFEG
jgi:hypothetical protein